MFLIGIAGFTLASLAAGLSVDPVMLITARLAQGGFGALLIPQGIGLLIGAFNRDQMRTAFSVFGPVMGASAIVGPILANTGSGNLTVNPGTYTSISNTGKGNATLNPGNYIITGNLTNTGSGGLILGAGNYTIGGNFQSTGSSSITLGSGLYIIGGNLQLTGSGPMTGSGITFYTEGSTTLTGSGNMNLSAPTSGTYNGVLAFQARSDTRTMAITGSRGGDHIKGILYAPNGTCDIDRLGQSQCVPGYDYGFSYRDWKRID